MVINATFNNVSVISWRSVLLLEKIGAPGKPTDLLQATDKCLNLVLNIKFKINILAFLRPSAKI
jgi:hypothetical protein